MESQEGKCNQTYFHKWYCMYVCEQIKILEFISTKSKTDDELFYIFELVHDFDRILSYKTMETFMFNTLYQSWFRYFTITW